MGTRGSAELRGAGGGARPPRSSAAARARRSGLPDAGIVNTPATRELLARAIRRFRPRVVIAPRARRGATPTTASPRSSCATPASSPASRRSRPTCRSTGRTRSCTASRIGRTSCEPTFVVDISDEFEQKMEAVRCYASQFDGATQAGEVYPNGEPLYDIVRTTRRTTARSSARATASRSSPPR